jgi:hypothetical protein
MRYTMGHGKYGAVLETLDTSWSDFTDLLADAAQIPRDPSTKEESWWVSPLIQLPGATQRRNEDVACLGGWFGADLDQGNWSIDALRGKLAGHTYVLSTTTSSLPDDHHWRIAIRTDREYSPDEHARLFRWFNGRFDGQLDVKCRNCSRIFFMPARWTGDDATNIFVKSYGRPVKVDGILALVGDAIDEMPLPRGTYSGALKTAPDGTPIITDHMLQQAAGSPEGGRLFRLMCQAAKRFRLNGWHLDSADLANAGWAASQVFSPGKKRINLSREAQRALDWAALAFEPQTPLEKMPSRERCDCHRGYELCALRFPPRTSRPPIRVGTLPCLTDGRRPSNMATVQGYDGGDGEPALLAALKEIMASVEADSWEKVRLHQKEQARFCRLVRCEYRLRRDNCPRLPQVLDLAARV